MNHSSVIHASSILKAFDIEPMPLDRLVDGYLRKHRELNSRERRNVSDVVFNVIRWRRRLAGYLELAGIARPANDKLVAAYLGWRGEDSDGMKEILGRVVDFPDLSASEFPGGPAAYWSFPDLLYEIFIGERGRESAEDLMRALNDPPPLTIRANLLKIDRNDLRSTLSNEGIETSRAKYSPFGLNVSDRKNFSAVVSFKKGLFEVQDEGSQLASMLVCPKPGETILDACAGTGGKSLFMAMTMRNEGRIVATDVDDRKLGRLRERANRAGARNIEVRRLSEIGSFHGKFDAILVDAPCSGTGTIRRAPDLKWRINRTDLDSYPVRQYDLLREYSRWLRDGGRLVYVTCSLLGSENESVVAGFLSNGTFSSLDREMILQSGIPPEFISPEGYFRVTPADANMDGFFAAAFIKNR